MAEAESPSDIEAFGEGIVAGRRCVAGLTRFCLAGARIPASSPPPRKETNHIPIPVFIPISGVYACATIPLTYPYPSSNLCVNRNPPIALTIRNEYD